MVEITGIGSVNSSKAETNKDIESVPVIGRLICFFIPTKNFKDRDNNTQYIRGLRYNLMEGNINLRQKVDKWQLEKKIRIL